MPGPRSGWQPAPCSWLAQATPTLRLGLQRVLGFLVELILYF